MLNYGPIEITRTSPGKMVVLCEGRLGKGFYVCSSCGAGFRQPVPKHRTPFGKDCSGTLQRTALGHEFETDILQLRFLVKPDVSLDGSLWFAYSLAYAIVERAADVLDIRSNDLNGTVIYTNLKVPPIVIYDSVPGGAGLVSRLESRDSLLECLMAAHIRVSGSCGCGDDDSCYGCLRNYRNQFIHQELRRGPVKSYLENIIAKF
jgi:hypothetical protein